MAGTNADVIINGVKARLAPVEGRYKRRTVRREIQQQLLTQSEAPVLRNRDDGVALYQTSWAAGARWWKPLLTPQDLASYFQANHMDVWSEPGKVVPSNQAVDASNTTLQSNGMAAVGADGEVFAIGSTNTEDSTNHDVYKWVPGSDAWVRQTGYTSGIDDGESPQAIVYDPTDGFFYTISSGDDLERFNPATSTTGAGYITSGFTAYVGSSLFLQNQSLMLYDGEKLYTVNKASPAVVEVFDDGMGPDFLEEADFVGSSLFNYLNLAISTPEGVYYVKNTRQGAQPVAWVFRVDKDVSGQWVGVPIATLPVGSVALDITHHLGQLIISTTSDWATVIENDGTHVEVVLYFVGEGGMGALGSILGNRDQVDETPFVFLGSQSNVLYIGGHKRLWIYDAIRGGLHTALNWPTATSNGPMVFRASALDSDGDTVDLYVSNRTVRIKTKTDDPDTVAAFGDDEAHYTLESNYFDGGLPMEEKEITRVAILRDKDDGGSEWTVQISADDGAFADALVDSGQSVFAEANLSGTSGYQFRYKLIYQTKDTARKALRALLIEMTTGDMITEWDLMLDGSELLNLDGSRQDPETFYDNMITLSDRDNITTIIDNYQEGARAQDAGGAGTNVKVVAVEIVKDTPGESVVRVLLREA